MSCILCHTFRCPCRSFQAAWGTNYLSFTQRRRRRGGREPRRQNYTSSSRTEHRWVGESKETGGEGGGGVKGCILRRCGEWEKVTRWSIWWIQVKHFERVCQCSDLPLALGEQDVKGLSYSQNPLAYALPSYWVTMAALVLLPPLHHPMQSHMPVPTIALLLLCNCLFFNCNMKYVGVGAQD